MATVAAVIASTYHPLRRERRPQAAAHPQLALPAVRGVAGPGH